MSGLLSLFTGAAGITDPILSALYGSSASGGNPVQALQIAQQKQTQDVAQVAAQPAIARDIAAFTQGVNSATSPAQLLANPAVMKVLLTASGMSDQIGFTALASQALLSDPSNTASLVNQLSDTRWKTVNQTYNFATQGLSVIQTPSVIATITDNYAQQTWLNSLNTTTPGLSNALSFLSSASTITSVDQILGDPTMRSVVTTALNIPLQIAFQDLTAQGLAITSQIDISRFSDPKFVQTITDQYLLNMQQQAATTQTAPSMDSLAIQAAGIVA